MKGWTSFLFLVACSAGDDVANGARDLCSEGGTLNMCPPTARTAQAACWKAVDCGALPLDRDMNFDWGECVEYIESMRELGQQLAIACITAATCDELKFDLGRCLDLGDP